MLDDIEWLHVEPTTRCNAWCSSCPRNNNGYGLTNFTLEDLSTKRLQDVIESLPKLKTVQFSGNLGDPCASKIIDKQLTVIRDRQLILQLHTNGSLRSKYWWKRLADTFGESLTVWFAIDGLQDTHHIYRQGTNWNKVIENAKSFIDEGGNAVWQFVPFAHNEHQIKSCIQLSQKLGFKRFEFVKNARYTETSFHYRTGKPIDIRPWSKHTTQWKRKGRILNKNTSENKIHQVKRKNCMHLALKSIFLNASGVITPCCYLGNTPLHSVDIAESISSNKFLPTCVKSCGSN